MRSHASHAVINPRAYDRGDDAHNHCILKSIADLLYLPQTDVNLQTLLACPMALSVECVCLYSVDACRALMFNFPLHSDKPDQASPSSRQGSSSMPEGLPSGAVPGPALTNLCLLVDVTASKLKRVGRYNLGRVVGRGAFGVVRLGQNTQSGVAAVAHNVLVLPCFASLVSSACRWL